MRSIAQPRFVESKTELAEARRQLSQYFAMPILRRIAIEVLDGHTVIRSSALIKAIPRRLRNKRPSIRRGILEITLTALRAQGHLPAEVRVVR